jgi:hypothetical protein
MPSQPMMHVWLVPVKKPGKVAPIRKPSRRAGVTESTVKRMKLTIVSPPWPHVGQELNYMGTTWKVTKTSGTRGTLGQQTSGGSDAR